MVQMRHSLWTFTSWKQNNSTQHSIAENNISLNQLNISAQVLCLVYGWRACMRACVRIREYLSFFYHYSKLLLPRNAVKNNYVYGMAVKIILFLLSLSLFLLSIYSNFAKNIITEQTYIVFRNMVFSLRLSVSNIYFILFLLFLHLSSFLLLLSYTFAFVCVCLVHRFYLW